MIAPSKCVGRHARPRGLFNFAQTLRRGPCLTYKVRTFDYGARPVTGFAHVRNQVTRSKKLELENTLMKPLTIAIIATLVVAGAVLDILIIKRE